MNLVELRNQVPWSRTDLARQSGLDYGTVSSAEEGGWITARTARRLAETLTQALGRDVKPLEIEGLRIKGVTKT